jgi:hypothetical protein
MTAARTQSIRKRIWTGDTTKPSDTAELARDVAGAIDAVDAKLMVVEFKDTVYAPPHFIDTQGRCPTSVKSGTGRPSGQPNNVGLNADPLWDFYNGQVRISNMSGLTLGTQYTFSFLLFFGGG